MSHTCPVWLGHLLNLPLRKLWHHPQKVLRPYIKPGMTALDVGCAMGFFTLPLAELVGSGGKVVAVDLQAAMISRLRRRAARRDLLKRLELRICRPDSLNVADLAGQVDFALAWFVIHEIPDQARAWHEIHAALRTDGLLLLAEPDIHVRRQAFEASVQIATATGFEILEKQSRRLQHRAVLRKPAPA